MKFIRRAFLGICILLPMLSSAQKIYNSLDAWKAVNKNPGKYVVVIGFITSDCVNCYANFNPVMKSFFRSELAAKNATILLAPEGLRQREYLDFFAPIDTLPARASFVTNTAMYEAMSKGIKATLFYAVLDTREYRLVASGSLKELSDVKRFETLLEQYRR